MGEARDPPSFDSLAMVFDGNRRNGIKRGTNTEQVKRLNLNLIGSTGVENKRGEKRQWNPYPFIQLVMERTKVGIKEARSPNPNPLVGCHDRATKWHKAIPTSHCDAVVITRSEEMT
jgi:hypothetical protein